MLPKYNFKFCNFVMEKQASTVGLKAVERWPIFCLRKFCEQKYTDETNNRMEMFHLNLHKIDINIFFEIFFECVNL